MHFSGQFHGRSMTGLAVSSRRGTSVAPGVVGTVLVAACACLLAATTANPSGSNAAALERAIAGIRGLDELGVGFSAVVTRTRFEPSTVAAAQDPNQLAVRSRARSEILVDQSRVYEKLFARPDDADASGVYVDDGERMQMYWEQSKKGAGREHPPGLQPGARY